MEKVANEKIEAVWCVYEEAFLKIPYTKQKKFVKSCERAIKLLEQRIARKKKLEPHQILNDMKELHKRAADIGYTVSNKEHRLYSRYKHAMRRLIQLDLSFLEMMAPSSFAEELIQMKGIGQLLREKSLYEIYKDDYMQYLVGQKIEELMEAEPEKQYPEARGMHRHFILHIGATNSGKTYQALQRLKRAYQGIYLGPLRLLALEVYDTMTAAGIPCSMVTGEESIRTPGSFCQASTVEILDLKEVYDIAVIDEAQMIGDENRGSSWTRAILGIRAEEIHVCASPVAEKLLIQMIKRCGDSYEVVHHERNTALEFVPEKYDMNKHVQKGDALITFSKKNVLAIAAALEAKGIRASVIYGNLPPKTRREQVELFAEGINEVVVATDAIGMGINLPIRRIIFMNTIKFDGTKKRRLAAEEIRQIAGRAGRYGFYETGYVQSVMDIDYIGKKLKEPFYPMKKARIGFPEVLLDINMELDEVMEIWENADDTSFYEKVSMAESVKKYRYLRNYRKAAASMEDKKLLLSLITCPFDLGDKEVLRLWLKYCENPMWEMECPRFPVDASLEELESYYKKLDLYHQFAGRMNWMINREELDANREEAQRAIGKLLKEDKQQFEKRCKCCNDPLPWDYPYRICEDCFMLEE
ncbi:MAG: helicase-related protein [Lachnospiraceae bacterium]|nr:helicase-related protein [Lachnospiraceae bacterium]